MKKQLLLACTVVLISSCMTTDNKNSEPEVIDVRQGEQVKQICFASSINGWKEVEGERNSVILTKGVSDEFKIELSGICDMTYSFSNIATRTRGSSCLTRGDEIIVEDGFSGINRCLIQKIYRWESHATDSSAEDDNEISKTPQVD